MQKKVAVLKKDNASGAFADEWKQAFQAADIKEEDQVDLAPILSNAALSIKDEKELRIIRDASRASSALLTNYFVEEMSEILDAEKNITHKALADKVTDKIDDQKFFQKQKLAKNFDSLQLDWFLPPTIQSGGNFDLKFGSDPDDKNLHAGVIVSALGLRYQTYGCIVGRTYMVDPNKKEHEANYKLLLSIHETIIKSMKDGVVAKDVYSKALGLLKSKKPELEKNFPKNVGYGIGTENRDGTLLLSGKNTRVLKDGMTLVVSTGFSDLELPGTSDKKKKNYSLVLVDTVRVGPTDCAVFTKDAPSDLESVSFFFNDDEEVEEKKPKAKRERAPAVAQPLTTTRTRHERATNQDAEKEEMRRQHQKELHEKKQQAGLETYGAGAKSLNGTEEKKFKRFESYKRDNQLPSSVVNLEIIVDKKALTVILPIMGRPVPFHIHTIKNASHTPESDFTSLRINFLSPGQGVGRKDDQPFEDPNAHFIRSLTFRSHDINRIENITRDITELKKDVVRREQEKKQLEDVVEQDKLVPIKSK